MGKDYAIKLHRVDGQVKADIMLDEVGDTIQAAMMLATATRVIARATAIHLKLDGMEEQVIAEIQKFYNSDISKGDLGEHFSTEVIPDDED